MPDVSLTITETPVQVSIAETPVNLTLSEGVTQAAGDLRWARGAGIYNVLNYGAEGDGTTDDSTAIQTAIDACTAAGGGTVRFPSGTYRCDSSLNLSDYVSGITLQGDGRSSVIESHAVGRAALDLVGSQWFTLRDLWIEGDGTDSPSVAFLAARTATRIHSGICTFRNVGLLGKFTVAGFYLIDAEVWVVDRLMSESLDVPYVYYTTTRNDDSIPSFQTIDDTTYDSVTAHYLNHWYVHTLPGINSTIIRLAGTNNSIIRDSYWAARGSGYGIQVTATTLNVVAQGLFQEGDSDVLLRIDDGVTLRRLTLQNFAQCQKIIEMGTNAILEKAVIDNVHSNVNADVGMELYDVLDSHIGRWWHQNTAEFTANDVTDSEIWLPRPYSQHTISGVNVRNQFRIDGESPVVFKSANYTIVLGEGTCIASGAGTTISLPENTPAGTTFTVKRNDAANNIVVSRSGADAIDGAVTKSLNTNHAFITVVSDGGTYFIVAQEGTVA